MNRGNKKQGRKAQGQTNKSKAQINQLKQLVMAELRASGATRRARGPRAPRGPQAAARTRGLTSRGDQLTAKGNPRNSQAAGNKQSFLISESEYIGEITPSAFPAFSLQQFAVNPGQAGTLPWLSSIARNFEKYEFEYLEFVYKREVSEYAANGQTGKVIMSFDTDASDPAPTNKQQMEDTDPHCDCMPSENMRLVVPAKMLKRFTDAFFVRPGALPANSDIKTYDLGNLFVACQGTAANTSVGELHVLYRVRLSIPVLEPILGIGALISGGATIAAATPFGTAPIQSGNYSLAVTQAAPLVLNFAGLVVGQEYLFDFAIVGTVISAVSAGTLVGLSNAGHIDNVNMVNAAATEGGVIMTFTATAQVASLTLIITATTIAGAYAFLAAVVPNAVA